MHSPFPTPSDATPPEVPQVPDAASATPATEAEPVFDGQLAPDHASTSLEAPQVLEALEPRAFEPLSPAPQVLEAPAHAEQFGDALGSPFASVAPDAAPAAYHLGGSVAPAPGGPAPDVWKMGEPDVVAAARPGALAPLTAMLLGGALSCVLIGAGFLLGARGRGVLDPVQQVGGSYSAYGGASSDSGNAIVQAVKLVGPAVMNVDTTFGGIPRSESQPPSGSGDSDEDGPHEGKGTGFVIDSARGLMLTNAHVVAGAAKIQVTSREGKVYSGRLIGADPANDVALVELSNRKLPQAHLANFSDTKQLRVGEWAIAIGNPYAQANSVTVGVVSAVGRQVGPAPMPGKPGQFVTLSDMIQTDAAINPGNSGGPLCNIHGEVIGINTAILPVGQGLGFTIPINKARAVAETLLRNGGKVPFIGVLMLEIDARVQKSFSLKESRGVYVQKVIEGSPADQAGMKSGDVIVRAAGRPITQGEQMQAAVRSRTIGDSLQIEISRAGKRRKLTMKIAAQAG